MKKKMKPSAAMRAGMRAAPTQAFFSYFGKDGSACAFGALSLGMGNGLGDGEAAANASDGVTSAVEDRPCPGCGAPRGTRKSLVPHLNDDHRWTVARIADWLESIGL